MSMQYKVYSEISSEGLIDVIDRVLSEGWTPQGGVSVAQIHNQPVYAQAMVKSEEKRGRPRKEP